MREGEENRLRALKATRLMDSPAEPAFDRLTRMAARLLRAPVALLSLVDDRRQFLKSAVGLGEPWASRREAPLSPCCERVVQGKEALAVSDMREHPALLGEGTAVRELGTAAYAGVPLLVDGEALGAFCVLDGVPHPWSGDDVQILWDLAESAVAEIQLRAALHAVSDHRALMEAVLESLGDAVLAMDTQRTFLVANRAARRVFAEAEAGRPLPADWAALHRSVRPDGTLLPSEEGALVRAVKGDSTDGLVFSLQRAPESEPVWVEASGRPVRNAAGEIIAGVAVYRDVTEKLRTEAALRQSEQIYRAIVQHLPNGGVFMVDRRLRFVTADGPIVDDVLAREDWSTMVGRNVPEVLTGENRDDMLAVYKGAFEGAPQRREILRGERFMEANAVPIFDARHAVSHALVFLYDVTERRREAEDLRRTRDLLARERALLDATLTHIEDGVVLLDAERRVILANAPYAAMFELPAEGIAGKTREAFAAHLATFAEDPAAFLARFLPVREKTEEFVFVRPRRRVLRRSEVPVKLPSGECYLATWRDVTSEKDLLAERERQLLVDGLTGIANRRAAEAALGVEDARRRRAGAELCVALFDVDLFKRVNDEHGHARGDEVLQLVARTLAGAARLTDLVARWGGEEFLAVLPGPIDGALAFAERARAAVEAARPPGTVGRVTVSAGVAVVGPTESPMDAVARADVRLYAAKRAGRNRVAS